MASSSLGPASDFRERRCTEAVLQQELEDAEDGIVVLEFVSGWCESCEFIYSPRITRVAEKFGASGEEDIVFLKVDVDRVPGAAEAFGVAFTPEFIVRFCSNLFCF